MQRPIPRLSEQQLVTLRSRHPYEPDAAPILKIAREHGWLEANITFLALERARGARAMRDLMTELGVGRVGSASEAIDLISLACQVFTPDSACQAMLARQSDHALRITAAPCPTYRSLEEREWTGVTACPSWHRRRGWLDALGVDGTISVVAEMKWGDPSCIAVVDVTRIN